MTDTTSDFVSHLEELRKRILICIISFLVASAASYFFSSQILDFLIAPLKRFDDAQLYFNKPHEAFLTHIKAAAFSGFLFSSPILFAQAWLFISPGLYSRERKALVPLVINSVVLFVVGAAFAYFVVIPVGLHFLLSFKTVSLKPLLSISPYFSFLLAMMFAFGMMFIFPVVLLGLVRLGVLSSAALAKGRKIIIIGIFIAAAVLTPSPEPATQLLLAGPLLILFEVSVFLAKRIEKKRKS